MRRCFISMALLLPLVIQGCGPTDNLETQVSDVGKNIIISPDSARGLDSATIKNVVAEFIDCAEWSSVVVLVKNAGVDYKIYGLLKHKNTYSLSFFQALVGWAGSKLHVFNITNDIYWPVTASSSNFYASCPDSSMETYWTTECDNIPTAAEAINTNNATALNRGYVSTKALGSGESLTNVNNYLSCSGLKMWGRVGHGYSGGLQLTGGQTLSSFSMSLDNHGVYANSCYSYNQPFNGQVMNAGAAWFVSGISSLYIGPSEKVFKCAMEKALSQDNVCNAVDSCMLSNAGTHGCGGPNQVIPTPGGGPTPTSTPNPTPTPTSTPNPTPTPGGESCTNSSVSDFCGQKSSDGCWCDNLCTQYGDCCPDYEQVCNGSGPDPTPTPAPTPTPTPAPTPTPTPAPTPTPTPAPTPTPTPAPTPTPTPAPTPTPTPAKSCSSSSGGDYCGTKSPDSCWCDSLCTLYDDCCPDYQQVCNGSGPGPTPTPSPGSEGCFDCHPDAHYPDQDCFNCHPDGCPDPG